MPLKDNYMFLDKDCIEYVLYHAHSTRFDLLDNVVLTQPGCIQNKHQNGCNTVYYLLENLELRLLHLILYKDQQFDTYIVKYSRRKVIKEMDKLIFSP